MKLVTVFTTFNPVEAQLIRSRLDAAGFPAFVTNENSGYGVIGASKAMLIHVEVPEDRADDARELLNADASTDPEAGAGE